jgi:hypothetical protein
MPAVAALFSNIPIRSAEVQAEAGSGAIPED